MEYRTVDRLLIRIHNTCAFFYNRLFLIGSSISTCGTVLKHI